MKKTIVMTGKVTAKPRNRDVAAMRFRKSGPHGKPQKAKRQAGRQAFDRDVKSGRIFDEDFVGQA